AVGHRMQRPDPLAAQRRKEEGAVDVAEGARARLARGPLHHGVEVALDLSPAFHDGPAVVATRLDAVNLIPGVLAELGGPQLARVIPRETLRIAMPERVDERARERIVVGHLALGRHAQDLAVQARAVLRTIRHR